MPRQDNFAALAHLEVVRKPPPLRTDADHVVEFSLAVPSVTVVFEGSGGSGEVEWNVPPGRYRIRVSGVPIRRGERMDVRRQRPPARSLRRRRLAIRFGHRALGATSLVRHRPPLVARHATSRNARPGQRIVGRAVGSRYERRLRATTLRHMSNRSKATMGALRRNPTERSIQGTCPAIACEDRTAIAISPTPPQNATAFARRLLKSRLPVTRRELV